MNFIKKRMEKSVYFLMLFIAVSFILITSSYDSGTADSILKDSGVEILSNGWNATNSDGESKIVSLPTKISSSNESGTTIYRTLPDKIEKDTTICFKSMHSRVCVMVDKEIIYTFSWDDDIVIGNTPGCLWNVVELKPEYAGKTLRITISSQYSNYTGQFGSVAYGDKAEITAFMINKTFSNFFVSCIPFVLGFLLLIISPFVRNIMKGSPLVFVGIFMINMGLWEITESYYIQFRWDKIFTLQMVNLITFALIPTLAIMALNSVGMIRGHFKQIIFGNISVFFVYLFAQLLGASDFFQSLWIIHLSMVIDFAVIYYDTSKHFTKMEKREEFIPIAASYIIIIVAGVIDIYRFYIIPDSGNGAIMRYAMIFFIVAMCINTIHASLKVQRSNIEKEAFINMAYTDNLTGINNRRCFEEDTEKLVNDKKSFNVVAIDMNNLKRINDELGHKFGDDALIKVAKAISVFEEFGEKCYRMGGDEFEVICTHLTGDEIENVCVKINEQLGKTEYFTGVPLAIAYGYFRYSANTDKELNKILAKADKKMYEKKAFMKANAS